MKRNPSVRMIQISWINEFVNSLNYIKMKPIGNELVRVTGMGTTVQGLVEEGWKIALYFSRNDTTTRSTLAKINLPSGSYNLTWIDTKTSGETVSKLADHPGGWAEIMSPDYNEDIAVKVEKGI